MHSITKDNNYDILIAGGGLSGLLALTRFRQIHPSARIVLIEKEQRLGGRLRTADGKENIGAGGLHYVSKHLYDFLNRTLLGCARGEDEFNLPNDKPHILGLLQGKKLEELPLTELCTSRFAKILGGASAVKQWESFLDNLKKRNDELSPQPLGKALNLSKKDPFLDILNIMSIPLGIVNPWFATPSSVEQRMAYIEQGLFGGPWTGFIDKLTQWAEADIILESSILDANFSNGLWDLKLEKGSVSGKALIVAQSPWEALSWLKRENSPAALINIALKYSPLSVISLVLRFEKELDLIDRFLIPSEKSQVFCLSKNEVCIQVIIDYETFLDAPRVVQAVKQAKRSKIKLCKHLEIEAPIEEFLSLRPVAWTQDSHHDARKQVEDYDASKLNSQKLVFCGDSYGNSYDPDQNLIKSLLAACSTVVI
jgi:hypothetical protein